MQATNYFFTAFFVVFLSLTLLAQPELPEYGTLTGAEIDLKDCSFDPEAEAIILFDEASTDYDDGYAMITKRRVRIKILNDKGINRANVVIPFYSGDNFEFIRNIEAITYTIEANGSYKTNALGKKSVFTDKRDSYYSLIKFAMPVVKAGDIIEYRYESVMKHYGGLENWEFQSDLPTLKSCYVLTVIPNAEFAYTVQKGKDYPIIIKPLKDQGRIYFEMNNVAGLRFEPYMDAPRDYIQQVQFQLAGMASPSGYKQNINTTWKSTAYDLMTEKQFGSQLDKNLKIDEVSQMVKSTTSAITKMKLIYNYVRDNLSWNNYYSKYAPDGLKKVWENKRGSAGEINLLLINLLTSNGFEEAFPMLVAERDFGKINPNYPFLDKFNKVVAFVVADGKQFILDATQKYLPAGLTPYQLLNTTAFLVDKKKYNLLEIASGNKSYRNKVNMVASLTKEGLLSGELKVESFDYAKEDRVRKEKTNREKFISEIFVKPYEGLTVDSFQVIHPDQDSLPMEQVVRFKQQLNESGGYIFINSNLFTGLEKNPFTSSIRFTNVNFGYPYQTNLHGSIKLPAGAKIDLPDDKILFSADNTIRLARQVKLEKDELKINIYFFQSATLVKAESYNGLRDFYKSMVDMLNEPLVVKLGN